MSGTAAPMGQMSSSRGSWPLVRLPCVVGALPAHVAVPLCLLPRSCQGWSMQAAVSGCLLGSLGLWPGPPSSRWERREMVVVFKLCPCVSIPYFWGGLGRVNHYGEGAAFLFHTGGGCQETVKGAGVTPPCSGPPEKSVTGRTARGGFL